MAKSTFEELVDSILDPIRKNAFKEGYSEGMTTGVALEHDRLVDTFNLACTVTKVVHNGYITVVEFADGCSEKVVYDPSYGYAYDGEKAVMAAMLKHLEGNRYISALKRFEARGEALVFGDVPVSYSLDHGINVSRHMIKRLFEVDDVNDVDYGVAYMPDGGAVNLSESERMLKEIASMNDDVITDDF